MSENGQTAVNGLGKEGFVPTRKWAFVIGTGIRCVLVDFPMMLIFGSFMFTLWVHYVHDTYWVPQMEAANWTSTRSVLETTYYTRYCDETDLTTKDPVDLILPDNATAEDAYNHQLLHGFTIFPGVLNEETATNLRNFIVERNHNLTEDEAIWLMKGDHRWSFSLGTEEPSVVEALMELASHKLLKDSMEKILGPDPAMIEMTAITSAYGAEGQRWHEDTDVPTGNYARAFGHAYSIFIPLQDTRPGMGATGACPGTYVCADGPLEEVCLEHGLQPINEDGYWRAGDAMVFSMDGQHRGSAHTEPGSPDRVILILSFTSKPRPRAESRQLVSGISYSLRWDMFGHTWKDLMHANTRMTNPWVTKLRALGVCRLGLCSYTDWALAYDYPTCVSFRIINNQFGFRRDDLEFFIDHGGFKFLPPFLHGQIDSTNYTWRAFILDTIHRCEAFTKKVSAYYALGYLLLYFAVSLALGESELKGRARRFGWVLLRVAVIHAIVIALYVAAIAQVDRTQWAKDLSQNILYKSPFGNDVARYNGPTTMPNRNDVLIESRFRSRYLGMFNDFVSNHPGNRIWNELLKEKTAIFSSYGGLPDEFPKAVATFVVGVVHNKAGRFLYQNRQAQWAEISMKDAVDYTMDELDLNSKPIVKALVREVEFLESEVKYGYGRRTSMFQADLFVLVNELKSRIMNKVSPSKPAASGTAREEKAGRNRRLTEGSGPFVLPKFSRSMPRRKPAQSRPRPLLHVGKLPGEPSFNAWLRTGDIVSVVIREKNGQNRWYKAFLSSVENSGKCSVTAFLDGDRARVWCKTSLKKYVPPQVGEELEVGIDEDFIGGQIIAMKENGLYDVHLSNGTVLEDVSDVKFRRFFG